LYIRRAPAGLGLEAEGADVEKENMMVNARFVVVREAIDTVLRRLQCVPSSDRTEQLHAWLDECSQEFEQWSASPPTDRERDVLMKRVLALHVAVTKLERDALFTVVRSSTAVNHSPE
jgi:hypothetical protein